MNETVFPCELKAGDPKTREEERNEQQRQNKIEKESRKNRNSFRLWQTRFLSHGDNRRFLFKDFFASKYRTDNISSWLFYWQTHLTDNVTCPSISGVTGNLTQPSDSTQLVVSGKPIRTRRLCEKKTLRCENVLRTEKAREKDWLIPDQGHANILSISCSCWCLSSPGDSFTILAWIFDHVLPGYYVWNLYFIQKHLNFPNSRSVNTLRLGVRLLHDDSNALWVFLAIMLLSESVKVCYFPPEPLKKQVHKVSGYILWFFSSTMKHPNKEREKPKIRHRLMYSGV